MKIKESKSHDVEYLRNKIIVITDDNFLQTRRRIRWLFQLDEHLDSIKYLGNQI